jgi:HD-like signal output (HDOD) protein
MSLLNNRYLITAMDVSPTPSQMTFGKLLTALENEQIDLNIVADIIQVEPSLSTSVLKLANSAYYGHDKPCESIQEALSCLGTQEVLKIVALTAIEDSLTREYKAYPFTPAEFWETAVLASNIMEQLASRYGLEPLTAYSIGLLHAIGKNIINNYLLDYREEKLLAPKISYIDLSTWERTHIGLDHADVTGVLMKKWNFPKSLRFPIQYQMRPGNAPDNYKTHAHLLRFSITMAALMAMPKENKEALNEIPTETSGKINISPVEALRIQSIAKEGLARVKEMMRGIR